jgi:hypothetical protein
VLRNRNYYIHHQSLFPSVFLPLQQHPHLTSTATPILAMPPKQHKAMLNPKQKGKLKSPAPQSEDDFLEAADEHEQAAGKWRAGDAAKATRFFNRAIDVYNDGLKSYPKSFDLAYNKYVWFNFIGKSIADIYNTTLRAFGMERKTKN